MIKKSITTVLFLFLATSTFTGCFSSKALVTEAQVEAKNNNLEVTLNKEKLNAIESIKKQIMQPKTNMSDISNYGEKKTDPYLYLYKGLRND